MLHCVNVRLHRSNVSEHRANNVTRWGLNRFVGEVAMADHRDDVLSI